MKKKYFAPSVCTIVMEAGTLLEASGVYDGTKTLDDEYSTSKENITYGEAKPFLDIWAEE